MPLIVPYRPNGATRAGMVNRTMNTTGTRATGRVAYMPDPRRTVQPVSSGFADLCGCPDCAPLNYEATKRQALGALGAAAILGQTVSGVKAGTTAAGVSTAIGTSVAGAIGAGAAAGSVVPIIGTAIGALVGLFASGVLNHRADPEVQNFNQASALYRQNPESVLNIADKYLVLAGLFDLLPGQIKGNIPIYKKYGRMGEYRFVTDMCTRIYQAAQAGQITGTDTPQTVMARIVQPWIDAWGYGPMVDSNADMITLTILGMVAEYLAGAQTRWVAVKGDYPFGGLPKFALPQPVAALPAPAAQVPANAIPTCPAGYVWNGTQCVLRASAPVVPQTAGSCSAPYVWNGSQCVLPLGATPPASALPPSIAPANPSAKQVPGGYTVVGADSNGNAVFANPQGVLYQYTASGMQMFSGQLASNSSAAAQMQAAIQNALTQGMSAQQAAAAALQQGQSAGVAITPQLQQQVAAQTDATQAAPVQATTAGFSLGNTAAILSIGATLLGLAFATARPARGRGRRRG